MLVPSSPVSRLALKPLRHVLVAGVAILSLGLAYAGAAGLTFKGSGVILGFYSPCSRAWEFAAGDLLALVLTLYTPAGLEMSTAAGVVGLLLFGRGPLDHRRHHTLLWALHTFSHRRDPASHHFWNRPSGIRLSTLLNSPHGRGRRLVPPGLPVALAHHRVHDNHLAD